MNHASQILRYLKTRMGLGPDKKSPKPENGDQGSRASLRFSNPFLPELPLREPRIRFTIAQHDTIRCHIEHGRPDLAAQLAMQCPSATVCLFAFLTNQNSSNVKDGKSISEYAEDAIVQLSAYAEGETKSILNVSLERFLASPFLESLGTSDPARQARLRSEISTMRDRLQKQ